MPFLKIRARIDMGAEAAELALRPHERLQVGLDARVSDQRPECLRVPLQERVEPHVADFIQPLLPALLACSIDPPSAPFRLLWRERSIDQQEAIPIQLVQTSLDL